MDEALLRKLHSDGLISDATVDKTKNFYSQRPVSLYWELSTILYLGVLLLSGGLAVLIYKNINSIGHLFILLLMALLSAAGYFYCIKNHKGFSVSKVPAPNVFFSYALLLSCLLLGTMVGYAEYQYQLFGGRYGLASFIPMLVFFFCAYYFDHLGVLSLAIVNMGAWLGFTVTPWKLLNEISFFDPRYFFTGLFLAVVLTVAAKLSRTRNIKSHFAFTYENFGLHVCYISAIAGMCWFEEIYLLWFAGLLAISYYYFRSAVVQSSFYIFLCIILYLYIAFGYVVVTILDRHFPLDIGLAYIAIIYFIVSALLAIWLLIRVNRKLKSRQ